MATAPKTAPEIRLPKELEDLVDAALAPMDEAQLKKHKKAVEKIIKDSKRRLDARREARKRA